MDKINFQSLDLILVPDLIRTFQIWLHTGITRPRLHAALHGLSCVHTWNYLFMHVWAWSDAVTFQYLHHLQRNIQFTWKSYICLSVIWGHRVVWCSSWFETYVYKSLANIFSKLGPYPCPCNYMVLALGLLSNIQYKSYLPIWKFIPRFFLAYVNTWLRPAGYWPSCRTNNPWTW